MNKELSRKAMILSPDLPWNVTDVEKLGGVLMKFMEDHEPFYQRWAETWYQNFQFVYGNQSLRWSRRYGFALDVDFMQRMPSTNMRAQTNVSRIVQEAIASYLFAGIPSWLIDASDDSKARGKRFRKIIQKLLDALFVRLMMEQELGTAANIFTCFGMVGAEINWDHMAGQIMEVPRYDKVLAPVFTDYMAPNPITQGLLEIPTPVLDAQGAARFMERWEAVVDQNGKQIVDKIFAGGPKVDILTPFEYRREVGSPGPHKTKYYERIRLLDYDQFIDEYAKVDGATKYFKSVKPVYSNPAVYQLAVRHFMRMQFTTPPQLNEVSRRPETIFRNALLRNKVLIIDHYDRPHPIKWPIGRRVVCVNGDVTHLTVPSYTSSKMNGWHPFEEASWLTVAPSHMATGPMNDVTAKNRELNIADGLIATAMRRNMGAPLLIKTGSGIDPEQMSGEPGRMYMVQDPFGARWMHDEMPIPAVLPSLRDIYKEDAYDTSGAMDSLRGDRTPGASSGYMLRQIQEREERRLSPARKRFERFVAGTGAKLFFCVKQNVIQLDEYTMGYLKRSAAGEYTMNDVISLLNTPADLGVDFNVEEGSMSIKSKATKMATMQELADKPAVSDRLGRDAEVLDNYLKEFDMEMLRDSSADHRDRAERENESFSDMLRLGPDIKGMQRPIVVQEDDDDIHIAKHTRWFLENSEEILANEAFYMQFLQHNETHRLAKQEKLGQLLPGTSQLVPAMAQQAKAIPTPTVQTVYQKAMMDKMQTSAQTPESAPQTPKQATGGPAGQTTTDPNAPAQTTTPAAKGGTLA